MEFLDTQNLINPTEHIELSLKGSEAMSNISVSVFACFFLEVHMLVLTVRGQC